MHKLSVNVTVEHQQHPVKKMSKSSTHYTYNRDFSDAYKRNKGTVEAQASYKLFSGSFKATWDNVNHTVTEKVQADFEKNSESLEFQDGFLQVVRVVVTSINVNDTVAVVKNFDLVDSIPTSRPLSVSELEGYTTRYLKQHCTEPFVISGITARAVVSFPPVDFATKKSTPPKKYVKNVSCVSYDRENTPVGVVGYCYNPGNDVNQGFGGKFTYIVATWTIDKNNAASGFRFYRSKKPLSGHGGDYAEGAGGDHRYIVRETGGRPIPWKNLGLWRSSGKSYYGNRPHTEDLNKGRKGDFLHLEWWY
mmetsp:Transcript_16955/g.24881  ORF Transcript_16955/g.24881 Transcript_16955/m.24881 type:complete len:306 (-) Transcript_16955:75-992(-)